MCSVLPDPPGSHFSCHLQLLPLILFLLPVTTYLLLSVIVSRPQGFCFPTETGEESCPFSGFLFWVRGTVPCGWPSSLAILSLKSAFRKTELLLEIPSQGSGTGQHLGPLIFQVSPLNMSIFSTGAPAFPTLHPGKKILPPEQREVLWHLGFRTYFGHTSLPTSPADLWETHCEVTPSFCRDTEAYSKQREWRPQITLCRITEMP